MVVIFQINAFDYNISAPYYVFFIYYGQPFSDNFVGLNE